MIDLGGPRVGRSAHPVDEEEERLLDFGETPGRPLLGLPLELLAAHRPERTHRTDPFGRNLRSCSESIKLEFVLVLYSTAFFLLTRI